MEKTIVTVLALALFAVSPAIIPSPAEAQAAGQRRCITCGRILGVEAPESTLSRDLQFRANGMFQECNDCFTKAYRGDKARMDAVVQLSLKSKQASIKHNKHLAKSANMPRRYYIR